MYTARQNSWFICLIGKTVSKQPTDVDSPASFFLITAVLISIAIDAMAHSTVVQMVDFRYSNVKMKKIVCNAKRQNYFYRRFLDITAAM